MSARVYLTATALLGVTALAALVALRPGWPGSLYWDDGVRMEVQEVIESRYVEPLDPEQERAMFDEAMRAYVGSIDPFSRFFTAEERRELEEDTTGEFAGVGVQVQAVSAGLLVSAVFDDGPADTAGIEPGDIVTAVDGVDVSDMGLPESIVLVKGEAGSEVTLDVVRDESPPRPYVVKRGMVGLDTVPSVRMLSGEPPVGYVRVSQFSDSTPEEVRTGLDRLVGEGAETLVLDLRRNLGGVVTAAVSVAGLFLPPGSVVCVTRERETHRSYATEGDDPAGAPRFGQPLVVLVDEGSASASEILAGALQDHGRAVLVGDRTYGKFLVQTLLPLRESEALVRITTARYETPRGRSGQRRPEATRGGIMPDVRVPISVDAQRGVYEAFNQQAGPRWRVMEGRGIDSDEGDEQLRVATDLLRGAEPPSERLLPAATERG